MTKAIAFATLAVLLQATPVSAQRQRLLMDPGWRFALGDHPGAEAPAYNDGQWRRLDLPHDWSIEGTPRQDAPGGGRVGFFPTGVGWYRKAFRLPRGAAGRRVVIEFDGVHMNSDVWINGTHLGRRPNGYISFAYEITPHLRSGVNVVAVRVDNSAQPNSRWYTGSGIYRHVWLTLTTPVHVGQWGTFVTTPRVDSSLAEVAILTRIDNGTDRYQRGVLRSVVLDPAGREVARTEAPFTTRTRASVEMEQQVQIASPELWSVETPRLYQVRTEVLTDNHVSDVYLTTFGIRHIEFHAQRGFLLNGRRVKMLGVNLHHDAGALGAAVPEAVWRRRLWLLKEMGANAVRTAHNPVAPEFLALCDSLGLLVMNEVFDEWTFGKVEQGYHKYFEEWAEQDVTDFVRRDRNHPSVVLWSAGNEIGEQTSPTGDQVLRRLLTVFHRNDPTRPVTTGNDQIHADGRPARVEFLRLLDVVGYNYVDRWRERREIFAEQDRLAHPEWKMIGTESGSIFQSLDEQYSLGDDPNLVRANYTSAMMTAERLWKWVMTRDWFAGNFMWTGIDYLGEATWPFKGFASGPLDITGQPKDAYALYQSLWTDRPVLRIFPHWNWPGREGQVVPVLVYSRCNIVELFLNGRSLGEKRWEFPAQGTAGGWNTYAEPRVFPTTNDLHLSWDVPYQPGVLRAVGKRRDGSPACEAEVRTAGPPAAVRLTADRDTITTGLGDVAHVTFEIVDSAGVVVPSAASMVRFTISGGTILALDNADLRVHDSLPQGRKPAYNGRGIAIVRPSAPGTIRLTAEADGVGAARVEISVMDGTTVTAVPPAR